MTAERKYGEPYRFSPTAKFLVAMNEPPVIPDKSYGFGRRLIVLNFMRRFEEKDMDPGLPEKLRQERDGIFMWALFGLERLLERGRFDVPPEILKERDDLISTMNPFLIFVEECCVHRPGDERLAVKPRTLYEEYVDWCKDGHNRALSRNKFYNQVLVNFPGVSKRNLPPRNHVHLIGITLKSMVPPAAATQTKEKGG